jgi:hypothetical protein
MLESSQHMQCEYFFDFSSPKSINKLLKRAKKEITYLFLPEDTTHMAGDCQNRMAGLVPSYIRSTVKIVFWVSVSIAIPLVIGNY